MQQHNRGSQDRPGTASVALGGLDPVDVAFIGALEEDGRTPYRHLARRFGTSESAARRRVRRMLDSGLVRVVGVTDVLALGFIRAEIGIRVKGQAVKEVARRLAELREADWVGICIGPVDIVVNVICADHASLVELIDTEVRTVPGVEVVETTVLVEVVKDDYRMLDIAQAARARLSNR